MTVLWVIDQARINYEATKIARKLMMAIGFPDVPVAATLADLHKALSPIKEIVCPINDAEVAIDFMTSNGLHLKIRQGEGLICVAIMQQEGYISFHFKFAITKDLKTSVANESMMEAQVILVDHRYDDGRSSKGHGPDQDEFCFFYENHVFDEEQLQAVPIHAAIINYLLEKIGYPDILRRDYEFTDAEKVLAILSQAETFVPQPHPVTLS